MAATEVANAAAASAAAASSKCSMCDKGAAKYCCPRCEARTCSVECVKSHKEATGCSGKRDRAAFVGRGQFNERAFMSDYRFLEEVKLADDVAKRRRPPAPKAELPQFLQTLVYQARRRGVQLHILPPGMEKRRTNSMRYDGRQQLLSWHIEWSFPAAGGCKVADARVDERRCLRDVLAAHLTLQPGEALVHEQLQEHVDVGAAGLTVLLRRERSPANAVEYYQIDTQQSLQEALVGKVIVEYPTFLVLLPREVPLYRLVSSSAQPQQPAQAQPQQQQQQPRQPQQQQQPRQPQQQQRQQPRQPAGLQQQYHPQQHGWGQAVGHQPQGGATRQL